MKYCSACNQPLEDNAFFCPYCGQKQEPVNASVSESTPDGEKAFHAFRRNLRHERKVWSIFSGVYLGFTIFYVLYFLIMGASLGAITDTSFAAGIMVFYCFLIVALMLPVIIVHFVMKNKLNDYIAQIETNPEPAMDRAVRPGMIVLGALFNPLAMVFIILNHIHVKNNSDLIRSR